MVSQADSLNVLLTSTSISARKHIGSYVLCLSTECSFLLNKLYFDISHFDMHPSASSLKLAPCETTMISSVLMKLNAE